MKAYILTLFPEMFDSVLNASILGRARSQGFLDVRLVDIRDFTHDPHKTVDDYPYGGGPGMVMKPEPVVAALEWVERDLGKRPMVALMTPQGETFDSEMAQGFAALDSVALVAGHYEGFDERIRRFADKEVSIGDFVLTGGELPAMVVLDALSRFIPGVLGHVESPKRDSFADGIIEGPQYTRPPEFRGMEVPAVLQSGDYGEIRRFRRKEGIRKTYLRRRDLLSRACLTYEDRRLLKEVSLEESSGKDQRVKE